MHKEHFRKRSLTEMKGHLRTKCSRMPFTVSVQGTRHSGPLSPKITTKVQLKGHFCFCLLYMNITISTSSFNALFPLHNWNMVFVEGLSALVMKMSLGAAPALLQTAFWLKHTGGNLPVKSDLAGSFQQSSCVLSVLIQLKSLQLIKRTC